MTLCSRAELLSMSTAQLVAPARLPGQADRLRRLADTGRMHQETLLRRKDGALLPVTLDAVTLANGRMMAYCKDATERIRAEAEQRTIREQLQRTQKLEGLGVLAGGIAHDFNNLLVGIIGNAELVGLDTPPFAPASARLQDILRAGERAAELCRQMLAYAGQASVEKTSIDLSHTTGEMAGLLGSAISRGAEISYDLASDLPPIHVDAGQVQQVIMNLITNAAESNRGDAVRIKVATGSLHVDEATPPQTYLADALPPGRYVFLEVEDRGAGMDTETQRRMFDPFFTTKTGGRGLGLAALVGIVRAHNGALQVDSAVDRGTLVRVLFPAVAEQEQAAGDRGASAATWRGAGTVLLADDESVVRDTARAMLESIGFEVVTARDGAQALAEHAARLGQLRCIVLDYSMPKLTGDRVLAELRRVDADVPVIVMSGFSDQGVEAPFVGLGVSSFVQKPFRLVELRNKLRQALEP